METINTRIQSLTTILKITKTDFAKSLKISQAYVSQLAVRGTPSERLIDSICTIYSVNKNWLLNGTEPIFIDKSSSEKAFGRFGYLMTNASAEKQAFISALLTLVEHLPDEDFKLLENEYKKALHEIKKES